MYQGKVHADALVPSHVVAEQAAICAKPLHKAGIVLAWFFYSCSQGCLQNGCMPVFILLKPDHLMVRDCHMLG